MTRTLRPLAEMPASDLARVRCVLTDIDDTLTIDGQVPAAAFAAMEHLGAAGIPVIPVTGRPAGWCDMIARTWPVAGVIGENGALAFRLDRAGRRMHRVYVDDGPTRIANRRRLDALAERILTGVPGARLSADQAYRETDLAIDFAEDVGPLPVASIAAIVSLFEAAGATAKVSSIHVNGWFGAYDKLTMARRFLAETMAIDIDRDRNEIVFVGDSPNDAPMFGHFPNAIGVANLLEMRDACLALPAWITDALRSDGFVEVTEALLNVR
ncbi:MAG: HAD-IIB family hydrolase [Proteobacteria bacterium]|nr:HAD-IIB family hydrolase [Pseudomonadota bacterium]